MSGIVIDNISVSFGTKQVLKNFSARIDTPVTCFSAPSGCGKTTLLLAIAGLIKFSGGKITGAEKNIFYVSGKPFDAVAYRA